jgi:CRP-like cAMP-binding protein
MNFVLQHSRVTEYQKSEIIAKEGEERYCLFLIASGTVLEQSSTSSQREYHEGDLFGEANILFKVPLMASYTSLTHCKIVEIPKLVSDRLFQSLPDLEGRLFDRLKVSCSKIIDNASPQSAIISKLKMVTFNTINNNFNRFYKKFMMLQIDS